MQNRISQVIKIAKLKLEVIIIKRMMKMNRAKKRRKKSEMTIMKISK